MSKTTTTASKSNTEAKAPKAKLSPLQQSILASLANTVTAVKALEVNCPTFTPSDAVSCLRKGGFTEQADLIESTERKAFDKEHGDAESTAKRAFRELLNAEFKAMLDASGLNVARKGGTANADGGERKDRVVLSDEQKEAMRKKRGEGAQLSKLAEEYNVSNPTAFNICKGITPTV